jgi:hypothetical protein
VLLEAGFAAGQGEQRLDQMFLLGAGNTGNRGHCPAGQGETHPEAAPRRVPGQAAVGER